MTKPQEPALKSGEKAQPKNPSQPGAAWDDKQCPAEGLPLLRSIKKGSGDRVFRGFHHLAGPGSARAGAAPQGSALWHLRVLRLCLWVAHYCAPEECVPASGKGVGASSTPGAWPGLAVRWWRLPRGSGLPLWDLAPCKDSQLFLGTAHSCALCSQNILCNGSPEE